MKFKLENKETKFFVIALFNFGQATYNGFHITNEIFYFEQAKSINTSFIWYNKMIYSKWLLKIALNRRDGCVARFYEISSVYLISGDIAVHPN